MLRRAFFQAAVPNELDSEPSEVLGSLTLIRVSRRAMATTFEIAIPVGFPEAIAASEEALDVIDRVEDQLTIYRETSEVSQLNERAVSEWVRVDAGLFDLLLHCAALTNETGGAFDAATGALVDAWGFSRREGRIPSGFDLKQARENSGFRHVILDSERQAVRFRRAGLKLNFGGIGKGYALDRAAECLRTNWGITRALLHGGGSSVYGLGAPPNDVRGWPVAIRHPWEPDQSLGTVWLRNRGLGTSAATFQFFEYNGKKYGHLLNPLTGEPALGTASASCVAPSAAVADALSTAMFVRGADWATDYLRSRPHLHSVILRDES